MDVLHRISFNARASHSETEILRDLEIPYVFNSLPAPPDVIDTLGLVTIEISESDLKWDHVKNLTAELKCVDIVRTRFTKREYLQAKQLELSGCWKYGYPMPDGDAGYRSITYTGSGCEVCGIGRVQKSSFRIKGEPKWGGKQILQLNWVEDEYFVTPEAYEAVFHPFGVPFLEVIQNKTEKPLRSVVQLVINTDADSPLAVQAPFDEKCSACGLGKFHPHTRGFFPKLVGNSGGNVFKSQEYFGSGGAAYRAVIVSNDVYRAIVNFGLKGVSFYPLEG